MRSGAPAGAWTPVCPGAAATTRIAAIPATTIWVSTVLAPGVGVAPRPFHVLSKPTGAICNLDCEYCFFLSKEALYPGSRFRMADELLETYIRQLIEAHGDAPEVTIAWQGGEPTLMGVEFFRRAIELAREYAPARAADRAHDPDQRDAARRRLVRVLRRARLPRRHLHRRAARAARRVPRRQGRRGNVRPRHPRPRPAEGARGRLERPLDGARRQRGSRTRRVPVLPRRARRDVHAVHPDRRARERHRLPGGRHRHRALGSSPGRQYGRFLVDVFDEWVRRDVGTVFVQMFDVALANWVGEPPGLCVHSRDLRQRARARAQRRPLLLRPLRRAEAPARQHPHHAHASSWSHSTQQREFGQAKLDTLPRHCRECEVQFACHGDCPKNRFVRDA